MSCNDIVLHDERLRIVEILIDVGSDVPDVIKDYQDTIDGVLPDSEKSFFLSLIEKYDLEDLGKIVAANKGIKSDSTISIDNLKTLYEASLFIEGAMLDVLHQAKFTSKLNENILNAFTDLVIKHHNANCGSLHRACRELIKNPSMFGIPPNQWYNALLI